MELRPLPVAVVLLAGLFLYLAMRGRLPGVWAALSGTPIIPFRGTSPGQNQMHTGQGYRGNQ